MYLFKNLRTGTGFLAGTALIILASLILGGCSGDLSSVTAVNAAETPTLPDFDHLEMDFGALKAVSSGGLPDDSSDNLVNAYLRTVVLEQSARQVLAAPVAAFAAAETIDPLLHDDGTAVWIYSWQHEGQRMGVILRGTPEDGQTRWELKLMNSDSPAGILWFSGTTRSGGSQGSLVIRDLEKSGHPVSGEINWEASDDGSVLEFLDREPEGNGSRLRFESRDPEFAITYGTDNRTESGCIRWDRSGSGSLRVPDFNGGREAFWNDQGLDVEY